MDMECALLDGEQKSETAELLKEKEILDHLNRKIAELDRKVIGEKTKVNKVISTIFCTALKFHKLVFKRRNWFYANNPVIIIPNRRSLLISEKSK